MGGQAIFEGGIHNWSAVGWSAFGGASAGGIGAIVLGAGYGATYLLGGAGSVTGGLVSGNVNGFSSAVLHFGIGGFLNMGGKWVGDKVANAINSRIAAKATDFVANSLFMDMMGEAWEIAGYQAMNQATQSVVNTATTQILHANGSWVNSLAYIIINQIISSFISGIY